MRVVGIDVGDARTGVAVSDPLGITAQGVETIRMAGWEKDARRVREICDRYGTDRVVCGLPVNMNGTEGPKAMNVRGFAKRLEELGLNVRFSDERLTTSRVTRTLLEADVRRAKRRDVVDMLAAQEILQGFMDAGGWTEKKHMGGAYHMSDRDRTEGTEEFDSEVTLVDEDGAEVRFEHLMTLEHNGKQYICLAPLEEMEDVDEDEIVILRIDTDEDGNDVYVTPDDEEEIDDVFEKYVEIAEADEEDD